MTSIADNFTNTALTGYATVAGNYEIEATFCKPDGGEGSSPVVQFLPHGIGFDRAYAVYLKNLIGYYSDYNLDIGIYHITISIIVTRM